jgi:hypothetical protein
LIINLHSSPTQGYRVFCKSNKSFNKYKETFIFKEIDKYEYTDDYGDNCFHYYLCLNVKTNKIYNVTFSERFYIWYSVVGDVEDLYKYRWKYGWKLEEMIDEFLYYVEQLKCNELMQSDLKQVEKGKVKKL